MVFLSKVKFEKHTFRKEALKRGLLATPASQQPEVCLAINHFWWEYSYLFLPPF
jgi:hypothetical protein